MEERKKITLTAGHIVIFVIVVMMLCISFSNTMQKPGTVDDSGIPINSENDPPYVDMEKAIDELNQGDYAMASITTIDALDRRSYNVVPGFEEAALLHFYASAMDYWNKKDYELAIYNSKDAQPYFKKFENKYKKYIDKMNEIINTGEAQAKKDEEAKEAETKHYEETRGSRGIHIGMYAWEVRESKWGNPEHINRTITANGIREQWVYGFNYVYLEGEDEDTLVVTDIQTSK